MYFYALYEPCSCFENFSTQNWTSGFAFLNLHQTYDALDFVRYPLTLNRRSLYRSLLLLLVPLVERTRISSMFLPQTCVFLNYQYCSSLLMPCLKMFFLKMDELMASACTNSCTKCQLSLLFQGCPPKWFLVVCFWVASKTTDWSR